MKAFLGAPPKISLSSLESSLAFKTRIAIFQNLLCKFFVKQSFAYFICPFLPLQDPRQGLRLFPVTSPAATSPLGPSRVTVGTDSCTHSTSLFGALPFVKGPLDRE